MEMEDQYGMADLRQLMNGRRSHFPAIPQPTELFSGHRQPSALAPAQPFEMMMMGGHPVVAAAEIMPRGLHHHHHHHQHQPQHHHDFIRSDNNSAGTSGGGGASMTITATSAPSLSGGGGGCGGLEAETGGCLGVDGGTGRWPRQETLTLLEIRSRLDSKFKEANQKGPLWDEVSRIMSEEHGYQRSGKKCREKFENLYKYYKKTKEGKAGRQDGKHYRFFRQLEALYGETSTTNNNSISVPETHFVGNSLRFHTLTNSTTTTPLTHQANNNQGPYHSNQHHKHCDSLSLSNSSEFDSSSSDDNDFSTAAGLMENDSSEKIIIRRKRRSRGWKAKIKEFIDSQMRKLMEKQEAWLEKLMRTLEQQEKERNVREEEWRQQEAARVDREHKFWAKERAWIEARDAALMEALQKLTGIRSSSEVQVLNNLSSPAENEIDDREGTSTELLVQNNNVGKGENWPEQEITRLIQLRTGMDSRFQQGGFPEEVLWEDIAAKMACLGYERSGSMCKDKWESINYNNNYVKINMKSSVKESSKKRKENNSRSSLCSYDNNFHNNNNDHQSSSGANNNNNNSLFNHGGGAAGGGGGAYTCEMNEQAVSGGGVAGAPQTTSSARVLQANDGGNSSSSPNSNANVHDSCFPFLMGEGSENLWENYGLKLSKGGQNQ